MIFVSLAHRPIPLSSTGLGQAREGLPRVPSDIAEAVKQYVLYAGFP